MEICTANINCPIEILIAKSRTQGSVLEEYGSDTSLASDALEVVERYASINLKRRKKSILEAEEGLALKSSRSSINNPEESPIE